MTLKKKTFTFIIFQMRNNYTAVIKKIFINGANLNG